LLLPAVACGLCGAAAAGDELLPVAPTERPRSAAVRPAEGLEIHYELLSPSDVSAGPARVEGVMSGARGELRSSWRVDPGAQVGQRLGRLDTAWQTQAPGPLQTVVVGDIFTGSGWSTPVRLGGVRMGRSPAARPGLTAPQAGVPVMPVLPLLDSGASDYEIQAGRLRSGWGTADDRYGESYTAAAYRAGLGAELTAEARAEWTPSRAGAGLELSRGLGATGRVRAVLAQSGSAQQSGLRWGMGLVQSGEGPVWSLAWDSFERGFSAPGASVGDADPRSRLRADATVPLGRRISAGLAYTRQTPWEAPVAGQLELSAKFPLPERSSLSLNYSHRAGIQPGWQAGLKLAVPLGGDRL
jgi:outer membrane usher protein FimD/PapC